MSSFFRRPILGLALGGGGARGLAHVGVLKALEDAGIQIDIITGASMGGIFAGLYAAGCPVKRLSDEANKLADIKHLIRLIDLSRSHRGLLQTDHIRTFLSDILGGDKQIEDLPIPVAVTSVDLKTRKEYVISNGSLLNACLATASVPGLFNPIECDGKLFIDGGVLNNVPADVARKMGAEVVIAVDVNYLLDTDTNWGDSKQISLSKFLPGFAMDLYMAEIIMVNEITKNRLQKARPDIIIRPPIPASVDIFLGFSHASDTIQAGENAVIEALPNIHILTKSGFRSPLKSIDRHPTGK